MPVLHKTESDAKKQWCPYARVKSRQKDSGSFNRHEVYFLEEQTFCIGSSCAKWDAEKKFNDLTGLGRCGA